MIVCNNVCVGICTRAPEHGYLCVYIIYICACVYVAVVCACILYICACVYVVMAQTYSAPQTAVERPHSASRYGYIGLEVVVIDKT